MKSLLLTLFVALLVSSPLFAACGPSELKPTWVTVTRPAFDARIWTDNEGKHDISTADSVEHIIGNQTIVAMLDTADCDSITASVSFSDLPETKTWLDVRLDRAGICAEETTPYPDTLAGGACLRLDHAGNGVCALVGSEVPFGQLPSQQPGGLYSLLYVAESTRHNWHVVGEPVIFENGPLQMDTLGTLLLSLSPSGDRLDASFVAPDNYAEIHQLIEPLWRGDAGFQVIHNPNLLCSPNRGVQQVNLLDFEPAE